jgi:hypothetical protein
MAVQKMSQAFDVGIYHRKSNLVTMECTGKFCQTCRRFTGFDERRMDQENFRGFHQVRMLMP